MEDPWPRVVGLKPHNGLAHCRNAHGVTRLRFLCVDDQPLPAGGGTDHPELMTMNVERVVHHRGVDQLDVHHVALGDFDDLSHRGVEAKGTPGEVHRHRRLCQGCVVHAPRVGAISAGQCQLDGLGCGVGHVDSMDRAWEAVVVHRTIEDDHVVRGKGGLISSVHQAGEARGLKHHRRLDDQHRRGGVAVAHRVGDVDGVHSWSMGCRHQEIVPLSDLGIDDIQVRGFNFCSRVGHDQSHAVPCDAEHHAIVGPPVDEAEPHSLALADVVHLSRLPVRQPRGPSHVCQHVCLIVDIHGPSKLLPRDQGCVLIAAVLLRPFLDQEHLLAIDLRLPCLCRGLCVGCGLHDQCPQRPIDVLGTRVSVVPVGSCWGGDEAVDIG
mmetsp:Transcript_34687/g.98289  ORF Transcript_34687/g.98289 Transcript_34687/m.98289 type:complete len:380 (+) Transcript_34687:549-1688(+)